MFSPTAIQKVRDATDAKNNTLVPKFIFPINNSISSPESAKRPFRFRDGIIIVTTPVRSKKEWKDLLEYLSKTCQRCGIPRPVRGEIEKILDGPTAMELITNIRKVTELTLKGRRTSDAPQEANSKPSSLSYFDLPRRPTIPQTVPRPTKPVACSGLENSGTGATESIPQIHKSAALPPFNGDNMPTTKHIKNCPSPTAPSPLIRGKFVDGTDWQDRLVPSAKMENVRRKHVTKLMEQEQAQRSKLSELWDLYSEDEEENTRPVPIVRSPGAGVDVPANPVLLTRDGQTRTIAVQTSDPEPDRWARINVWRIDVAIALNILPQRAKPIARGMRITIPGGRDFKPPSIDGSAEKRKMIQQDWRRPREQGAANKNTRLWPTKILARDNKPADNNELGVSKLEGKEKLQNIKKAAKISADNLEAVVNDSAIVLEEKYEVSGAA